VTSNTTDLAPTGLDMHELIAELFPLCRSITGPGTRETLARIDRRLPLALTELPTGQPVLDWTVPKEWRIDDAWIAGPDGRRLVDFRQSNLHVVGYSTPVRGTFTREALEPHLHSLPDRPTLIPWRTSFYTETWGFCLSQQARDALGDGPFEVGVDASLTDGHLVYGEAVLPGRTDREILLTTHICHPSLCNDNLSGIALAVFLGRHLAELDLRHTVRILFAPGTIGSISWLAVNDDRVGAIDHGLVLTGVGDRGAITYKRSRRGDAEVDRTVAHVLATSGRPHQIVDFSPYGYDERQFCSPGYDLPVGRFSRTLFGSYPEYHTSGDDLDFVTPESLADSFAAVLEVILTLDGNETYRSLNPKGEPQLGRRGLYRSMSGSMDDGLELALLWVLSLADGRHSLLEVAERAGAPFARIRQAADLLVAHELLEVAPA
jgi:aminopeptidase-like protein